MGCSGTILFRGHQKGIHFVTGGGKRSRIEKWCSARTSNEGLKRTKEIKKENVRKLMKHMYEKASEYLFLGLTRQRQKGTPVTRTPSTKQSVIFSHTIS
jgi:hypothetical protein